MVMRVVGDPFKRIWDWLPPRMKWRKMLILWLVIQSIAFALHVTASVMLTDADFGLVPLREIPCNKINVSRVLIIALPINIVASLITAGTNYTRQILLAPSRADLDRRRDRSWHIGVSSLKNLGNVNLGKKIIWWSMGVATLPLHML